MAHVTLRRFVGGGAQNIATTTQVAVDATGSVNVFAGANQTDFIIDVVGFTTF